jgi:hypothetical protein
MTDEVKNAEVAEAKAEESNLEDVSELNLPIWAVVNFDSCVANDLTYAEAFKKLQELKAEKVSGLCIITNEAAARISSSESRL